MIPRPPTIYVDPGVKYAGWCVGAGGVLIAADKTDREHLPLMADTVMPCPHRCVMERPWGVQAIKEGKKGSTLQDILDLTLAAGEYAGHFDQRVYLMPYPAPKPIRHERALEALDRHELARLPRQKTYRQHTLCAVYMFLRDVGRITA